MTPSGLPAAQQKSPHTEVATAFDPIAFDKGLADKLVQHRVAIAQYLIGNVEPERRMHNKTAIF